MSVRDFYIRVRKMMHNILHLEDIIEQKIEKHVLVYKYEQLSFLSKEIGVSVQKYYEKQLIVSLTTYGDRIYEVYLTIESLMQQTLKPNKIILWLAKNEFNDANIPIILNQYVERGLTISYCEDLKSYKKLVPTLINYPDSIVITVDDDVIYYREFVENFYKSHIESPDCILFNRGHKMIFRKTGELKPYLNWDWEIQSTDKSLLYVPTGNGGVLYPPNCFHPDVIRSDIFMELCPTTDDLWFRVMALKKGIFCKKGRGKHNFMELQEKGNLGLNRRNNGQENINDRNINILIERYDMKNINQLDNE